MRQQHYIAADPVVGVGASALLPPMLAIMKLSSGGDSRRCSHGFPVRLVEGRAHSYLGVAGAWTPRSRSRSSRRASSSIWASRYAT